MNVDGVAIVKLFGSEFNEVLADACGTEDGEQMDVDEWWDATVIVIVTTTVVG